MGLWVGGGLCPGRVICGEQWALADMITKLLGVTIREAQSADPHHKVTGAKQPTGWGDMEVLLRDFQNY